MSAACSQVKEPSNCTQRALDHTGIWQSQKTSGPTVDSNKLEYGSGIIWAGLHSSLGLEVGGQSSLDFLASTVIQASSSRALLEGHPLKGPPCTDGSAKGPFRGS